MELTGDMKELYKAITVHLRKTLPECNVEDFFFETDTAALRHDMAGTALTTVKDCLSVCGLGT